MRYDYRSELHHHVEFGQGDSVFKCFSCGHDRPIGDYHHYYGSRDISQYSHGRGYLMHPFCHRCAYEMFLVVKKHPMYNKDVYEYFLKKISQVRGGARSRGFMVTVEHEDLIRLFVESEGRCAISGLKMSLFEIRGIHRGQRAFLSPSVDRINSEGNYALGNIQIVASIVNSMKNDLDQDRFVDLCRAVVSHQSDLKRKSEDDLLSQIGALDDCTLT